MVTNGLKAHKTRRIAAYVSLMVLLCAMSAMAAPKIPAQPQPAQLVNDFAGLLGEETRRELEGVGREIREQTKAEIVLVTVPSLDGSSIEEYALTLFRGWGLGDKEKNNGVLLLVDNERLLRGQSGKVRIEVGYGLEGAIPDGKAGRILDEMVLPLWEQEEYDSGIRAGYLALVAAVANEYGIDLEANTKLSPAVEYTNSGTSAHFVLVLLPLVVLFVVFVITMTFSRRRFRYPWWWGGFGDHRRGPFDDFFGGGGSGGFGGFGGFGGGGGGGFGGFGGGSSGGGGASR